MAVFTRVSNYLWSYVAPRKTQQKREKPHKVSATSDRTPIATAAKVQQRRERHDRKQTSVEDEETRIVAELEDNTPDRSIEGTPASNRLLTPSTQRSRISAVGDDEVDANDSTLVMTEQQAANEAVESKDTFDPEAWRRHIAELRQELQDKGWAGDGINLFVKLASRGKEPLLPRSWELEFDTLPLAMFMPVGYEPYVASSTEAGDFRAAHALKDLIRLGPRVRDAVIATAAEARNNNIPSAARTKKTPESVLKKGATEYLKWAHADAKLNVASPSTRKSLDSAVSAGQTLPLILSVAGPSDRVVELQATATDKLVKLGEQWKVAMRSAGTGGYITELPTLYGIICTYTVFALVAYDIDFQNEDGTIEPPFLRHIAVYDFSNKGHDVWNSLALAILGIHVREELIDIRGDVQAVRGPEYGVVPEDDTDA